MNRDLLNN